MYQPKGPFRDAGYYEIPISGGQPPINIVTSVSADGTIAWAYPNSQNTHPQFRGGNGEEPVNMGKVSLGDVARMLQQIIRFKTEEQLSLDGILGKHEFLTQRILRN